MLAQTLTLEAAFAPRELPVEELPLHDPSDAEDLRNIRDYLAGNTRAFELLFDKYREKVYRVAYRFVRNKEDALEVTQDVFLRVAQGLAGFKTDSKFFTWLYRIAANRAIDVNRRMKSKPLHGLDNTILETHTRRASGLGAARDPAKIAEERDLKSRLAAAVEKLTDKHRTVFLLHAMENLSYKEIAEVMRCSIGTVMSRLFYARKKLQDLLGGAIEPPPRRRIDLHPDVKD